LKAVFLYDDPPAPQACSLLEKNLGFFNRKGRRVTWSKLSPLSLPSWVVPLCPPARCCFTTRACDVNRSLRNVCLFALLLNHLRRTLSNLFALGLKLTTHSSVSCNPSGFHDWVHPSGRAGLPSVGLFGTPPFPPFFCVCLAVCLDCFWVTASWFVPLLNSHFHDVAWSCDFFPGVCLSRLHSLPLLWTFRCRGRLFRPLVLRDGPVVITTTPIPASYLLTLLRLSL